MTDEELTTCHNLLDMLQDCNGEVADYWGRMLEHIDGQSSQIATLKAALRKDRFFRVWANTRSTNVDTVTKIADRQLAKEYPDIDWGGQP